MPPRPPPVASVKYAGYSPVNPPLMQIIETAINQSKLNTKDDIYQRSKYAEAVTVGSFRSSFDGGLGFMRYQSKG